MKLGTAVLAALVISVAVCSGQAACPCEIGEIADPEGTRLSLSQITLEIRTSDPCYVAHGWGIGADCGAFQDGRDSFCDFARKQMTFTLRVNGSEIPPTMLNVMEVTDYPTGCTDPAALSGWGAGWVYEFPARYFQPGIYILEGIWSIELPVLCFSQNVVDCLLERGNALDDAGNLGRTFSRTAVLTVLP